MTGTARGGDRLGLLAEIAKVGDGSLPLSSTVERILDVIVPAFADLAVLDTVRDDGELRRLAVRVDSPRADELEQALLRRRVVSTARVGVAEVIRTGQSQLVAAVTDEHLQAAAGDEPDLELLRSLGFRSWVVVALRSRGETRGALICGVGSSGRTYSEEDLHFAEVLAGRVALALDNAGLRASINRLERRVEATLENLAEAVVVRDAEGAMVLANRAAAELLGVESREVMASSAEEMMSRYEAFDEHGTPLTLSDLPSAQAARGERPPPMLVRNVSRATGEERWLRHKATPVFDPEGELSMVINVIEDVTEVKRAELAQRMLAAAGAVLSSSLDYEQTLQAVARLTVPGLADWCGVRIREGDLLKQVAVAHTDPAKVAMAEEFGERYPVDIDDSGGAARVVRSGESMLVPEITEELLEQSDAGEEQLALVRQLGMRSVIIVPLEIPGRRPIGALTLVMADSGRVFDEADLELAVDLARRAAVAVENARLYTERAHVAETLQRSLLPPELPELPGFQLASLYRPAGAHDSVGGDFYDVFTVPGGLMLVVGDVAGRGVEAAALTSLGRHTLRTAGQLLADPVRAVAQLNSALRERSDFSMLSVCCVLLREANGVAEAEIVLAGHPPPYHVHEGAPNAVGAFGPFLGAYDDGAWESRTVRLAPGDQLVLYTDGVTDVVGVGGRFGEARLIRALQGVSGASEAIERIDQAIRDFAHGPQFDDTAVLAVERAGVPLRSADLAADQAR